MTQYNKMTISLTMGDDDLSTPEKAQQFLISFLKDFSLPAIDGTIACRDVNGNKQEVTIAYEVEEEEQKQFTLEVVETRKVTCYYRITATDYDSAKELAEKGECDESEDISIDDVTDRKVHSIVVVLDA